MNKILLAVLVIAVVAIIGIQLFSSQKVTAANIGQSQSADKATIELTKAEFLKKVVDYESNPKEWKYLGEKPAIVDFYASWCGPCKMLSPILEELAKEHKDEIIIYKVNTENEPELAAAFGIRSIPTLLFIPMEGNPQMIMGAQPKPELNAMITKYLLNNIQDTIKK